jgi:hypothetical protein
MYRILLIIAALVIPQVTLANTETDCRFSTRIDEARGINFKCEEDKGKASKASGKDAFKSCKLDMVVTIGASCPDTHSVKTIVTCLGVLNFESTRPGNKVSLSVKGRQPATIEGSGMESVKMTLNWNAGKAEAGFIRPEVSKLKCSALITDVLVN